jgi:4-carboxymuconolactone decarboxylase
MVTPMSRLSDIELPDSLPIHNNLVRALWHNPDIFKDFGRLSMRVHTASHLDDRLREIAVLRVIARLRADFEWGNHVPAARQAGVTDDEIVAIRDGNFDTFAGRELIAIRFADAVDGVEVDDALWAEGLAHFSEVELLDLTLLVAFYGFASRCVRALGIGLDDGCHGFEQP